MNVVNLINKKKQGTSLSENEIEFLINGYIDGSIPDYQMSALLMAIYFKGMTRVETVHLTKVMMNSGDIINLDFLNKKIVDKHSTGGVGDKTTLIVGPLLASFDLAVAKMSGRGLGHTGGTVDKLEALNGFNSEVSEEQFISQVSSIGICITGQSKELVPADKKLYALRDVTGTVDSIPLIASSIMSKKLASGAHFIILDVKYGSGAFMNTIEEANELATELVSIGNALGRETKAVISFMDQPLGNAVGNALEVKEAIDTLRGNGPEDITLLSTKLTAELLVSSGVFNNAELAEQAITEKIKSGIVYEKFLEFIQTQGADKDAHEQMGQAKYIIPVVAKESGYVKSLNAELIGRAAMKLGAGRQTKNDVIDLQVGIIIEKKIADFINIGDELAQVHASKQNVEEVINEIYSAYEFSDTKVVKPKIIEKIINKELI